MKKRILSIILSLALIFGFAAIGTVTASAEEYGDFEYELLEGGTVEITDYQGHESELIIPETIDGKTVTAIGNSAFILCESLQQITIPGEVKEIGSSAFHGCSQLKSVVIPDGVTTIADEAFSNCISLKNVTLPNNLEVIYNGAFADCSSLESISIPSSVKSIGNYAFNGCEFLNSVTFADDSQLERVASDAFDYTGIYCDESNWENRMLYIGNCLYSGKYMPYDIEDPDPDALEFAQGDITVKTGTKVIADGAFFGCTKLTGVTMPSSLTHIGSYAFYNCENLGFVRLTDSVKAIGESAFCGCDSMKDITVPDSVTEIGEYALGYTCGGLLHVIFFRIICSENSAAEKYAIENEMYYRTTAFDYGDANNDGAINMLDVLLIRKYIAKQPVTIDIVAADVTDDSKVNMLDVLLIRKYIAKQPVMLGPKPNPPAVESPDVIESPDIIETPEIL